MNLLYKLLRQDPNTREGMIATTSALGVIVNVLIALTKVVIGILMASISIVSEGINNAADAMTSILTLVGTKLAGKRPDEKHPFGYGRIEYLTSLVVSVLILVAGFEMLKSSVELIFHPEELQVNYVALIIIAVSAAVKFFLGIYTIRVGRKTASSALEGVGLECRNDAWASLITMISSAVFLIFGISLDAYAGVLVSLLILKAGFDVLRDTLSELIGRPGEKELAAQIYRKIRTTPGVIAAADMMLHNYGPDAWSGSVNVEMDHAKSIGEVYEILHALQLRIMHEQHVTMVFGIYAVDNDSTESREIRKTIAAFTQTQEHVKSYHAVYCEPETQKIYCDFIVDYALRDWDGLQKDFQAYMAEKYPDREIVLTVETEYV